MKRFVVAAVLMTSAFACTGSPEVMEPHTAAPAEVELHEDAREAADDLVHTIPTGSFATVNEFCAAQKTLILPKIAEANAAFQSDAYRADEKGIEYKPECVEFPAALTSTSIALAAPYTAVKAVSVETGYSTEIYLLARATEGWSAVRSALIYDNHNDPGCGSIERPLEIKSVHVAEGAIVITTTADRTWWAPIADPTSDDEKTGLLVSTYARACRATASGIECGWPEIVEAKATLKNEDKPEEPVQTRFFTTTFKVSEGVKIEPATKFDPEML